MRIHKTGRLLLPETTTQAMFHTAKSRLRHDSILESMQTYLITTKRAAILLALRISTESGPKEEDYAKSLDLKGENSSGKKGHRDGGKFIEDGAARPQVQGTPYHNMRCSILPTTNLIAG